MTDILERAKAVDPEMLAVLNWGALRDLISELIAEVEAKQANNEYLQKMTEEAQGIMQESQLLLCKEANEAEQLQNEVERLRSRVGMGMNDDWWLTIDDPVELGKVIAERALIAVMEAMQ